MHRPGIEPGSIAWQATILPLNHRCLFYTILIVWTKFCSSIQFFLKLRTKIMKNLFRSNWGWVQLSISVVSSFLTVDCKTYKKLNLHFSSKTLCAASAGTRTRVYCLAGDSPATEPLMLELSFSPFEQKLCPSIFYQFFVSKSWKIQFNWVLKSSYSIE